MVSADDFFICVFESSLTYPLVNHEYADKKSEWFDDETKRKLEDLKKEAEEIDYESINNILTKLGALNFKKKGSKFDKRKNLMDQYSVLAKRYTELGEIDIETEKGYHIIILTVSNVSNTGQMYTFLRNMSVRRGKKEWVVDKEMILDIYRERKELYRLTLEKRKLDRINNVMADTLDLLQEYINKKYPVKFKHRSTRSRGDVECGESKNGILRGIVHRIGYVGGKDSSEIFCQLFNSGYLEVQHKRIDKNTGIFTRLLGYGMDTVDDIYLNSPKDIYLILSLSVLEDFDYWMSTYDAYGDRTDMSFYKGFCNGCEGKLKPLQDYSAAERGYMALEDKDSKKAHELVLSSDVNLKRYVDAIYIPDKTVLDEIMSRKEVPLWVKSLVTNKDNVNKVYRKNCLGEKTKKITKSKFDKISKLVAKREKITDIPPLNIESINKKKKIQLIYRDDVSFEIFPPDN